MWYAVLIILLLYAVLKWQIYKYALNVYIGFTLDKQLETYAAAHEWVKYIIRQKVRRK